MCSERLPRPRDGTALGKDQSDMRAYNEKLVLSLLRQVGPIPRSQIARATGLSPQSCSVIMRALETAGLVRRGAPQRGRIGQPSVPMMLAEDGAFSLGLQIRRDSAEMVLMDFLGAIRASRSCNYRAPHPDTIVRFARTALGELAETLPEPLRPRLRGLGVALPDQPWLWADEPAARTAWQRLDLAEELRDLTDLPIYAEQDIIAACRAEMALGSAIGASDLLYIQIRETIRGAVVQGGKPLQGGRVHRPLGQIQVCAPAGGSASLDACASLGRLAELMAAQGALPEALRGAPAGWPDLPEVESRWRAEAAPALAQVIGSADALLSLSHVVIAACRPPAARAALVQAVAGHLEAAEAGPAALPALHAAALGPQTAALGAAILPLAAQFLVQLPARR